MTGKTRKRQRQIGRGAVMEEPELSPIDPYPPAIPYVSKVLGRGGFGLVLGYPRLPMKSEEELYRTTGIGPHIEALLSTLSHVETMMETTTDPSAPKIMTYMIYKELYTREMESITNPDGKELFKKLCTEVVKLYAQKKPRDRRTSSRMNQAYSFLTLSKEAVEVQTTKSTMTPDELKILNELSILPKTDLASVLFTADDPRRARFSSLLSTPVDRITDETVDEMESILPDTVKMASYDILKSYAEPKWINRIRTELSQLMRIDISSIPPGPHEIIRILSEHFTGLTYPLGVMDVYNALMLIKKDSNLALFKNLQSKMFKFISRMVWFYEKGFAHNDMKTPNLMTTETRVKFIDFGSVNRVTVSARAIGLDMESFWYRYYSPLNILRITADYVFRNYRPEHIDENSVADVLRTYVSENPDIARAIVIRSDTLRDSLRHLSTAISHIDSGNPLKTVIRTLYDLITNSFQLKLLVPHVDMPGSLGEEFEQRLVTSFITIYDKIMFNSSREDTMPILLERFHREITLRNEVYSLSIVLIEMIDILAKLFLDRKLRQTSSASVTVDGDFDEILVMLMLMMVICHMGMNISVEKLVDEWLPLYKEKVESVKTIMSSGGGDAEITAVYRDVRDDVFINPFTRTGRGRQRVRKQTHSRKTRRHRRRR